MKKLLVTVVGANLYVFRSRSCMVLLQVAALTPEVSSALIRQARSVLPQSCDRSAGSCAGSFVRSFGQRRHVGHCIRNQTSPSHCWFGGLQPLDDDEREASIYES